ncbi:CNNM family magnesium/cobalt transport protein CorC [Buchnera aphidicola]|uniref:CNNM family magnesium/cobalt transport protein CorC n=1 Tax=Buchnera aphidicola TaxID=9 RepID=UPI0034642EED
MNKKNKKKNNKKKEQGFFSILIKKLFQEKPKNREELIELIRNSEQHELIDETTCNMLEGVMDIAKQTIQEIMIPRTNMITIQSNFSFNKCLDIIIKSAHSRFPVMSNDNNYVQGFLMAKDLLPFITKSSELFCMKNILRPPIIVPESKYVDSMLKEFRINRYHMAIVINEFGYVSGLVTIEDILELIVGDIEDEYDNKQEIDIHKINQSTFIIGALTPIKIFNKIFKSNLNDTTVDTIGGYIIQKFQYLPKIGEEIIISGYRFKIYMKNNSKIIKLKVITPNQINITYD